MFGFHIEGVWVKGVSLKLMRLYSRLHTDFKNKTLYYFKKISVTYIYIGHWNLTTYILHNLIKRWKSHLYNRTFTLLETWCPMLDCLLQSQYQPGDSDTSEYWNVGESGEQNEMGQCTQCNPRLNNVLCQICWKVSTVMTRLGVKYCKVGIIWKTRLVDFKVGRSWFFY